MPQPMFTVIRRSAYHGYVPQTNAIHEKFVKHVLDAAISRKRRNVGHTDAVTAFSDALGDDQKTLFETALLQVGQCYAKVWHH